VSAFSTIIASDMSSADPIERVALKDLAVVFGADERPHAVGVPYNPFGMAAWINAAGMALVLVSKQYLLFGPLVVRALRIRGLLSEEQRGQFYERRAELPTTGEFLVECASLLVKGKPFERLEQGVVFRPQERGEEFYLVRRV
jgi:hypothetical protein